MTTSIPRLQTPEAFASWLRRRAGTAVDLFDQHSKTRKVRGEVGNGTPGQKIVTLYTGRPSLGGTGWTVSAYVDLADLAHWASGLAQCTAEVSELNRRLTAPAGESAKAVQIGVERNTIVGFNFRVGGGATLTLPDDTVTQHIDIPRFTLYVNGPAIALGTTGVFLSSHANRTPRSGSEAIHGSAVIGIAPNGDRTYKIDWRVHGIDNTVRNSSRLGRFHVNAPSIRQDISSLAVPVNVQHRKTGALVRRDIMIALRVFVPAVAEAATKVIAGA